MARLYSNENFPLPVVESLRKTECLGGRGAFRARSNSANRGRAQSWFSRPIFLTAASVFSGVSCKITFQPRAAPVSMFSGRSST